MARAIQVAASGVCGVTAVVLILGAVIARLTTSTKQSAAVVTATLTIAGALVGGYAVAPHLNRLTGNVFAGDHEEGPSSSR